MPNYRRAYQEGGTFFFTIVTYCRRPLFEQSESRHLLRKTINRVRTNHPFIIDAWVLLPDHMHCIWTLPQKDTDYSIRWNLIKSLFSKKAKKLLHKSECMTDSRRKHGESSIWQRRFWEHLIRDEKDYNTHMDYIHYNPVKHELANCVKDWPHSTFHRYARNGIYSENWGGGTIMELNLE